MPTTSEALSTYLPRHMPIPQPGNKIVQPKVFQPMTVEQFVPYNVEPPMGTKSNIPREINTTMDDIKEIPTNQQRRAGFWLIAGICLLALLIIAAAVTVPLILLRKTTTSGTSTTTTSVLTSLLTTITSTLTTIPSTGCLAPYVQAPSGSCVNVLIDINNCGSIGNNCSTNYTSCSAGTCSTAPGVQLANADFLWTAAVNGSVDDYYFPVNLPFNITLYNTTVSTVSVTTNGVICFGSCSGAYSETNLPTSTFSGVTVFAYWDDLYIYSGTSQGIYYATQNNAPNRTLVFEFYMSHFGQSNQYYHYQILFFEARPNIVQYKYYEASDGGATCTIGVQASGSGPYIQYSFDVANSVRANMSLTFDTTLGTYTNSTF